jgi:hypothetical protein
MSARRLEPGRTYRARGGAITIVSCHSWHDRPDEPGWYTIEQGAKRYDQAARAVHARVHDEPEPLPETGQLDLFTQG